MDLSAAWWMRVDLKEFGEEKLRRMADGVWSGSHYDPGARHQVVLERTRRIREGVWPDGSPLRRK